MRLARIVKWDRFNWCLEDDTEINPEVGTIVQVMAYPNEGSDWGHAIYFPGSQAPCIIRHVLVKLYFEWLE